MHKTCRNVGDNQSLTAEAMFDGKLVQVKKKPNKVITMQTVKSKRDERAKAITKM